MTFNQSVQQYYPELVNGDGSDRDDLLKMSGVVLRFGLLSSASLAVITVGLVGGGYWLIVSLAGIYFFKMTIEGYWFERRVREDLHREKIAALKAHVESLRPRPQALYARPLQAGGDTQIRIETIPPRDFLEWLYQQGRVVGEKATSKQWGDESDEWYDVLVATGWIVGRDGDRRQSGKLQGNLPDCVSYFYPETTVG